MKLAIIGLPQTGKKTIFHLYTDVPAEKAPTRDGIAYAVATVRDPRIDRLVEMYKPKRVRYAEFEMALPPDIAPSQARSAPWLQALRKTDASIHVVRAFTNPSVFHISGSVDPVRDVELVEMELLLADLDLVEKRLQRMAKEHNRNNPNEERERAVLEQCKAHLEGEKTLRTLAISEEDQRLLRHLSFLTLQPTVTVINVDEDYAAARETWSGLANQLREQGETVVFLSASIESEIAELPEDEQQDFLASLGMEEPAAHRLSRAAYDCLGLISFFTVGPDEVRAWPLRKGAAAPEAAGRIHSDMERGFIRAEKIAFDELTQAGSEKAARDQNLYRLKGKDYIVEDGDILEIRFNI